MSRAGDQGGDMVFFEDSLHGGARDRLDSELAQLAEDAGVTPAVLGGEFEDQLAYVFRRARPTSPLG